MCVGEEGAREWFVISVSLVASSTPRRSAVEAQKAPRNYSGGQPPIDANPNDLNPLRMRGRSTRSIRVHWRSFAVHRNSYGPSKGTKKAGGSLHRPSALSPPGLKRAVMTFAAAVLALVVGCACRGLPSPRRRRTCCLACGLADTRPLLLGALAGEMNSS